MTALSRSVCSLLLCTGAVFAQDDPPEAQPLPAGPDAVVEKQVVAELMEFRARLMIEDYRSRCGDREPDAEFEALLRAWSADEAPHREYTAAVVTRAAHRAPADPLMHWLFAQIATDDAECRRHFQLALDGLERTDAMPLSKLIVNLRARQRLGDGGGDPFLAGYCDAMVACVGDPRMAGIGQRHLIRTFKVLWPAVDSNARGLIDRMLAVEAKDRYAVLTLDGDCHTSEAWDARSSKAAREVTDEGWKGFGEHLEAAAESLIAAHEMHPEFPEAPAEMITVCGGAGAIDAIRSWLDAAVAAQFDCIDAYHAAFHFYSVRWGGSRKLQLDLGMECADTGRFDTLVPQLLRNAIGARAKDIGGDMRKAYTPRLRKRLDELHEQRLQHLTTVAEAHWELSQRGVELLMFERTREGVELLESIDGGPDRGAATTFGGIPEFIRKVREEAAVEHVPMALLPIDIVAGWENPTYPGAARRRPLPRDSERPGQRDFNARWMQFLVDVSQRHYRDHTTDPAPLQPRALEAIAQFLPTLTRQEGAPTPQAYLAMLDELEAGDAKDPLLAYYRGRLLETLGRADDALATYRASLDGLQQRGYPPLFALFVHRRLVEITARGGATDELAQLEQQTSRLARETARMAEWQGDDREFFLSIVWPENRLPVLRGNLTTEDVGLLAADQQVDPWLRATLEGIDCCQRALNRPHTPFDGATDWFALTDRAADRLREAHRLDPTCPLPAAMMISVCHAAPQAEPARYWFDEAVAARFDYLLAYHNLAIVLSPMAGGTLQDVISLAMECVATERFDTGVPGTFATIVTTACDAKQDQARWIWASPAVQDAFTRMAAGYTKDPQLAAAYGQMGVIAKWAGGRYDDALAQWEQMGRPDLALRCEALHFVPAALQKDLQFLAARATASAKEAQDK